MSLAPVGDLADLGLVAASLAGLAGDVDVLEEVHLELLEAVALARLAPAAGHVEGEVPGGQPERLRPGQAREELADLVERLDVRHRVRARGPPDRLLVDEADAGQVLEAGQRLVGAGRLELRLERPGHRAVERVVDERGLAGARDPGDAGERVERDPDREVLEVVRARADQREVVPAAVPPAEGQRDDLPARTGSGR